MAYTLSNKCAKKSMQMGSSSPTYHQKRVMFLEHVLFAVFELLGPFTHYTCTLLIQIKFYSIIHTYVYTSIQHCDVPRLDVLTYARQFLLWWSYILLTYCEDEFCVLVYF